MGWSSGSNLFSAIADIISAHVRDDDDKKDIFTELVELFVDYDCDTLHECDGADVILDEVLREQGILDSEDSEE